MFGVQFSLCSCLCTGGFWIIPYFLKLAGTHTKPYIYDNYSAPRMTLNSPVFLPWTAIGHRDWQVLQDSPLMLQNRLCTFRDEMRRR